MLASLKVTSVPVVPWPSHVIDLDVHSTGQLHIAQSLMQQASIGLPIIGGRAVCTPPDPPHLDPALAMSALVPDPAKDTRSPGCLECPLAVATANVLSLTPSEQQSARAAGIFETGRMQVLQSVFLNKGLQLIGIQEARSQGPEVRVMSHYVALSSGSTPAHTHGCELWIAASLPFLVAGKPVLCTPSCVSIVKAFPTLLVASLSLASLRLRVAVAHAPPSDDLPRVHQWWQWLHSVMQGLPGPELPCIMMIDANARIGSHQSDAIGPHAMQQESVSGQYLRSMASLLKATIPQTFETTAIPGPAHTWSSKRGAIHRIDYLLWPQAWPSLPSSFGPDHTVDISNGTLDHYVVEGRGTAVFSPSQGLCRRRRTLCDARKLARPPIDAVLRGVVANAPRMPWRASASDSLVVLTRYLQIAISTRSSV